MSDTADVRSSISLSSPYAPLTPEGPLPPALSEATVSSAYKALRPDLRAKQVLATLGIRPGFEQASRVLRRAVDRPEARAGDDSAPEGTGRPPLFLALYVLLRDHLASADFAYNDIVKPAEREREERTFLDPELFAERIRRAASRFTTVDDRLTPGSDGEALALFALAYGLLQPEDAPAIVGAVAGLGPAFASFFGVAV